MKNWKELNFFTSGQWERVTDLAYRDSRNVVPAYARLFRALAETQLPDVKVLILGQDPYPRKGVADGLAFSAKETSYGARNVPASLQNVHREYIDDLSLPRPSSGDLSPWAHSGVLLLNTSLTTIVGRPGAHSSLGWEELVGEVIQALERKGDVVFILWGKHAQDTFAKFNSTSVDVLRSAHPSPLSASKGFFGSRPFSRANALLGPRRAVDWRLP